QLQFTRIERDAVTLADLGHQLLQRESLDLQARGAELGLAVTQQIFDQLLQVYAVLAQDADDLLLTRLQAAGGAFGEELRTLAQGGQRRLQFVRDMAQKLRLLFLQLLQTLAQPDQLLAQLDQIVRPLDHDTFMQTALAQSQNAGLDLRNRTRQQMRKAGHDQQRHRHHHEQLQARAVLRLLGLRLERTGLAVNHGARMQEHGAARGGQLGKLLVHLLAVAAEPQATRLGPLPDPTAQQPAHFHAQRAA